MGEREIIKCPNCGGNRAQQKDDGLFVCDLCGTQYRDNTKFYELKGVVKTQLLKLEETLLSQDATKKGNLKCLLLREIEKDKFSSDDVLKYCEQLLMLDPDDIIANYFEKFCRRKKQSGQKEYLSYLSLLGNLSIDECDKDLIITFMVSHVDDVTYSAISELLTKLGIDGRYKDLLESSYKNYLIQYSLYNSGIERKVFICHKSQDIEQVYDILLALENEYGPDTCWISERNLRYDTVNYWDDIYKAIDKCEYFLVVTSQNAMYSEDVQKEMEHARKEGKPCIEYILDKESKIYDKNSIGGRKRTEFFRQYFDGLQWIDGSEGSHYREIIKRIEKMRLKGLDKPQETPKEPSKTNDTEQHQIDEELSSDVERLNISKEVKDIKDSQYQGYKTIRFVRIPKSVERIGKQAFKDCDHLEKVEFEEGSQLEIIDNEAFCNCGNLIDIDIPLGVKKINSNAFYGCKSLESIEIPNSVSSIGESAFEGCNLLIIYCEASIKPSKWKDYWNWNRPVCWGIRKEDITIQDGIHYLIVDGKAVVTGHTNDIQSNLIIPSKIIHRNHQYDVTSIEKRTFEYCSSLTSITIPNSVTSIGYEAFSGCTSLSSIEIPSGLENIGSYAFQECVCLASIDIPNSVISIGDHAFIGCESLTIYCEVSSKPSGWINSWNSDRPVHWGVNIEDFKEKTPRQRVIEILARRLESVYLDRKKNQDSGAVTISDEVNEIRTCQYQGNKTIKTITIPSSVKKIGDMAFKDCENLKKVIFEDGSKLKVIGQRAFEGCTSLLSIKIPNGVENIGSYVFQRCSSLTSIEMPSGMISIESCLFNGCTSLTKIEIPSNVESIGGWAFRDCTSLTSITIPNSVTSMGDGVFEGCTSLTIDCEASLKPSGWEDNWNGDRPVRWGVTIKGTSNNRTLNQKAVEGPQKKTKEELSSDVGLLNIPNGVKEIKDEQYLGNEDVQTIKISNSVESIGNQAFKDCINLKKVIFEEGSQLKFIGNCAFEGCNSLTDIEIPNSVTSIEFHAFDGGKSLTIYCEVSSKPSGWKDDWNWNRPVYWGIKKEDIIVQDSLQYLIIHGKAVITGHTKDIQSNLIIPSKIIYKNCQYDVSSIGKCSFIDCSSLTSVIIPNSVTSIEYCAFSVCTSLTNITIPKSVTSIGKSAFCECSSLANIIIPNSVTSIDNWAFDGCKSLKSIIIPDSVTSIGKSAFNGCSSLTNITIPNSVISIGDEAFKGCKSLTNITIPNSVTSIESNAFEDCSSLKQVVIPKHLKKLARDIFPNCKIKKG